MADEPRPDPEEQVAALCRVLNEHGVDYLVFGSFAGRLHGADVHTRDVDVVPRADPANLQRLADALNALRPRWRVDEEGPGMKVDGKVQPKHFEGEIPAIGLVTQFGYVDVLLHPKGFERGYEDLAPNSVVVAVEGVEVRVGALADLIRSKGLLGRQKDRNHLPLLQARQAELDRQSSSPEPG